MLYKYILIWFSLTAVFGGIIWLIASLMPEAGWLYWVDVVLIVIVAIVYIILLIMLMVLYYIESHADEITDALKKTGKQIISVFEDACKNFWTSLLKWILGKYY